MTQHPAPAAPQWSVPTGQLVLNLTAPWGTAAMVTPRARIDGYPAPVRWGRNEFTAPAGPRHVELSCSYLWDYGFADDTVPVTPNSRVEVYYASPRLTFLRGRIGPVKQPHRGGLALLLVLILLAIVVASAIVGAVLDS